MCLIIIITWMHSNVSISSADIHVAADNTVNGSSELKWPSLIPQSIACLNMMSHSTEGLSENITTPATCAVTQEGMWMVTNYIGRYWLPQLFSDMPTVLLPLLQNTILFSVHQQHKKSCPLSALWNAQHGNWSWPIN